MEFVHIGEQLFSYILDFDSFDNRLERQIVALSVCIKQYKYMKHYNLRQENLKKDRAHNNTAFSEFNSPADLKFSTKVNLCFGWFRLHFTPL